MQLAAFDPLINQRAYSKRLAKACAHYRPDIPRSRLIRAIKHNGGNLKEIGNELILSKEVLGAICEKQFGRQWRKEVRRIGQWQND